MAEAGPFRENLKTKDGLKKNSNRAKYSGQQMSRPAKMLSGALALGAAVFGGATVGKTIDVTQDAGHAVVDKVEGTLKDISSNLTREVYGREDMVFQGALEINLKGLNFRPRMTSDLDSSKLTIEDIALINGVSVSNIKNNRIWIENPVLAYGPEPSPQAARGDWIRLEIGQKDQSGNITNREMFVSWGPETQNNIKTYASGSSVLAKEFHGETGRVLTIPPDVRLPEAQLPRAK